MSSVKHFRKFVVSVVSVSIPDNLLPPSLRNTTGGSMVQVALGRPYDWAVNRDWHYHKLDFTNKDQTVEYEAHLWLQTDGDEDKLISMFKTDLVDRIEVPDYIAEMGNYPPMSPQDYIDGGDAWDPVLGEPPIKPGERGEIVEMKPDGRMMGALDPQGRFAFANERTVYTHPDLTDREIPLGRCCHCGENEAEHILLLPLRAPVDGSGWGCRNCDAPCDGAVAVACTECLSQYDPSTVKDMEVTICVGFPADNVRIIKTEVTEEYWHLPGRWDGEED